MYNNSVNSSALCPHGFSRVGEFITYEDCVVNEIVYFIMELIAIVIYFLYFCTTAYQVIRQRKSISDKKNHTKFMIVLFFTLASLLNIPGVILGLAGIKASQANYKSFLLIFPIGVSLITYLVFFYFQTKLYVKANFNKKSDTLKYLRWYLIVNSLWSFISFTALSVTGLFVVDSIIFFRLLLGATTIFTFNFGGFSLLSVILVMKLASEMDVDTAKSYASVRRAFLFINFYIVTVTIFFAIIILLEIKYLIYDYILWLMMDILNGIFGIILIYLLLVVKSKTVTPEASSGGVAPDLVLVS